MTDFPKMTRGFNGDIIFAIEDLEEIDARILDSRLKWSPNLGVFVVVTIGNWTVDLTFPEA